MPFRRVRAVGVAVAITVASLGFGAVGTAMAGTPTACLAVITKYQHPKGKVSITQAKAIEQQVGQTCSSISVIKAALRKKSHGAPATLINQIAGAIKDGICSGLGKNTKLCH